MKRLHVHVAVEDLSRSVGFYSTLFGVAPTVLKDDYAKWQLEDPRVNFAISNRGAAPGLDHLGIQVDSDDELAETAARLSASGEALLDQGETTCCYARSNKRWTVDPTGIAWETFHTTGTADTYGESAIVPRPAAAREQQATGCGAEAAGKAPSGAAACCAG